MYRRRIVGRRERLKQTLGNYDQQRGFLLPVALVLIVGISALALAIGKLNTQANNSSFREGVIIQAFYAAESGMQYGMNQLMFPSPSRASAATNCTSLSGESISFSASGLSACSTELTCASTVNDSDSITFFTLSSAASCGSGEMISERTIQASAYIRD